ncbi:hypothetical protein [Coprococcus catus]|uniref:hypothetical protein n=1 Tax=Coprococcus catus TaxID=116085 RepID=UPI003D04B3C8
MYAYNKTTKAVRWDKNREGTFKTTMEIFNMDNTIRPSSWRKAINLKQNKNIKREQLKQEAIDYVKEKYNIEVNDDIADAICIGDAVLNLFNID